LDGGIRELETLLARYQTDGALFLDGQPKRLLPDLYYLGEFAGAGVYGFVSRSMLFLVDAPDQSGLVEFLRAPLRHPGLMRLPPPAVLLTSWGSGPTAGLVELIDRFHSQVVASPQAVQKIKATCPPGTVVVSALDLPGMDWFKVRPVLLQGGN